MGELMHSEEHDAIDRLLPWFVNRTLEPDEHDRVRRHVEDCGACREAVSLLSAAQSAVSHASATPMVPPPRADRLLEAIDGGGEAGRRPRLTALAASLAAALLAAALLLPDREGPGTPPALYETATSTAHPVPMDYVLDIRFARGTPLAARDRVLQDLEARDVSATEAGRAYRITVRLPATSLEELEDYARDVESRPEIESAAVVALQLPVTRPQ